MTAHMMDCECDAKCSKCESDWRCPYAMAACSTPGTEHLCPVCAPPPKVYFTAFWIFNRAILLSPDGVEHVVRRYRAGESREASTVELVPVSACEGDWGPDTQAKHDRETLTVNVGEVEDRWKPTGKSMYIGRAPL